MADSRESDCLHFSLSRAQRSTPKKVGQSPVTTPVAAYDTAPVLYVVHFSEYGNRDIDMLCYIQLSAA